MPGTKSAELLQFVSTLVYICTIDDSQLVSQTSADSVSLSKLLTYLSVIRSDVESSQSIVEYRAAAQASVRLKDDNDPSGNMAKSVKVCTS